LINPIQYTSRTFNTILADINSDNELKDKPNWWKRIWAGVGDVFSMWENASAKNLFLRTAFTQRAVLMLLELIDYQMTPQSTSSGTELFYLKGTVIFPVTISQANLAALSVGSLTVSSKRFEALSASTVAAVTEIVAAGSVAWATGIWTVVTAYMTGEKCRLTGADLPAPLATGTDYYIIAVSSTQIKMAASLTDAYNGTAITLTDSGTGNHTINMYSFRKTLYQQETRAQQSVGTSDGTTEFQEFDLPDKNVLESTIVVVINSVTWTRVDTLVNSGIADTHYKLIYNTDNSSTIQFGDGTYGAIPGAFPVLVTYAVGGGDDSNVSGMNNIRIYAGNDTNVDGVSNPAAMTGGGDPEGIESAKILGPLLLKARDRFVTTDDGLALCLAYGGISNAVVIRNYYGVLSAKVCCIATGGGNPSAGVKTTLQAYLIDRTILETIDVRVVDSTITAIAVTSAAKMKSGYVWADVQPYFRLAWKMFLSDAGREIYFDYLSNGVESTVVKMNAIFTESFAAADYTQIVALLEGFEYSDFGKDIQESDAFAFVAGRVSGIDYITIAAPAFPVVLGDTEITNYGALTLTEIP
jgi:hypothetical protein